MTYIETTYGLENFDKEGSRMYAYCLVRPFQKEFKRDVLAKMETDLILKHA